MGGKVKYQYELKNICKKCKGIGGFNISSCNRCKGTAYESISESDFMNPCEECHGIGIKYRRQCS